MIERIPYVPGGRVYRSDAARSVAANAAKDVTHEYRWPNPRADTRNRSPNVTTDWSSHGLLPLLAALAVALIADGGTLLLIAWWPW